MKNEPLHRLIQIMVVMISMLPSVAFCAPIFPEGEYLDLDKQMLRHNRQFYEINARPFGLSLDAHALDEESRTLIDQYLAQDETEDFAAITGKHPFETLAAYGEYGDLGFFGGVGVVGTAYSYMTMKRDGASEELLSQARERVVRAAKSWHIFKVIPGGEGLVARGIRRMVPENPEDPPIPVTYPEMVPLFDEAGDPLPQPKNNGAYRYDNSGGELPEDVWIWKDSCSKDQLVGQVFAMTALYDAMKGDPDIDQGLVTQLEEDAAAIGRTLMEKREISVMEGPLGSGEYDLIIMDADGRPTFYHDLHPSSLEKIYFRPEDGKYNVFNLFMGLGVIKGLLHISGDLELEEYLYVELMHERDFLGMAARALEDDSGAFDYIYQGINTNFDNPDMTALAMWLIIYNENDPEVLNVMRNFLEVGWWQRADEPHTARLCKQPLWHAIYMAITASGVEQSLIDELVDLLLGFSLGPYWNDRRENCDATEIEAGECLAIDGETVLTLSKRGDSPMATEALHPSIRPPSNFDARSNPFNVNGGGGMRLNPGPDLLASYWIGRYMQANASGEANSSHNMRDHMPVGGIIDGDIDGDKEEDAPEDQPDGDSTQPDGDTATDGDQSINPIPDDEDDSGCRQTDTPFASFALLLLLLATIRRLAAKSYLHSSI